MTPSALLRTSVVIPALNEAATVGKVVESVLADGPLEVIVIDSDSTDATADRAHRAGARVVNWREILPHIEPVPGKGEALWRGVATARGEFVAFVDADLIDPRPHIVRDLISGFASDDIQMVKANYQRQLRGAPTGGGRVTELMARPLLRQFLPQLSHLKQPLSGEYAIRSDLARKLPFAAGYGVEIGLLIDVAARFGSAAIAEVDLGTRAHRNRPLEQLAPMADEVLATVLTRVEPERWPAARQRPAIANL